MLILFLLSKNKSKISYQFLYTISYTNDNKDAALSTSEIYDFLFNVKKNKDFFLRFFNVKIPMQMIRNTMLI